MSRIVYTDFMPSCLEVQAIEPQFYAELLKGLGFLAQPFRR